MKRTHYAILVFLSALTIYAFTLSPSVGSGNAASWVVNSLLAGLPPAPGSLLYLLVCSFVGNSFNSLILPLLAKLPVVLSIEPATGVNLVSALSAAGAAALSFALLDRLVARVGENAGRASQGGVRWILAAGVLFSVTLPSVWSSSLAAGPGGFNLFLIVLSVWLLVRAAAGEQSGSGGFYMLLWAYLAGLSFSQQHVFLFGVLFLVVFLVSDNGVILRELKSKWLPMLLLFGLGLSIYLYISVRPVIDPGLGGSVGLFHEGFWAYLFNPDPLRDSFHRNAHFFKYQAPLFWSYLSGQAGHWIAGAVAGAVMLYALIRLWQKDRKLFLAVLVILLLSALAALWLVNPKLGFEQAWDMFPDPTMHEPEHIDNLFLPVYLLSGFCVVLGLIFLRWDLGALFEGLARKMEFKTGRFVNVTGGAVAAVLVIMQLGAVCIRWPEVDMSGFYVFRDMAENMLKGVELDGILILRNDNEYYPAIYVDKFGAVSSERSLINYFRLSDPSYIKGLKRSETSVAMTYPDSDIDRLRPARLDREREFDLGGLKAVYPQNTVFLVRDIAVLDILRANRFERPVYFSSRLGEDNLVGLNRYMALQGLAIRLFKEDPLTSADSLDYWRRGEYAEAVALDMKRSTLLLWDIYNYHTTVDDIKERPWADLLAMLPYSSAHIQLGDAFIARDNPG
ncbi:MAG: DUF2723 domain-containing protein, partial [Gemmatimonadota bacterium]|nr:DUF2723 domain-containing protein [Gemmatimonadota bacterium]